MILFCHCQLCSLLYISPLTLISFSLQWFGFLSHAVAASVVHAACIAPSSPLMSSNVHFVYFILINDCCKLQHCINTAVPVQSSPPLSSNCLLILKISAQDVQMFPLCQSVLSILNRVHLRSCLSLGGA